MKNHLSLQQVFCCAALLVATSVSWAAPTVTGKTITWPDDGWYQVQVVGSDGIVEVCQGGQSCDVLPGQYIVINLTTGERFVNIVVTETSDDATVDNNTTDNNTANTDGNSSQSDSVSAPTDGISVDGIVIRWPDNGWYQVQDEATFTEVCGGTRSCTVEPGTYVVINHTTGERFEGIRVAQRTDVSNNNTSDNNTNNPDNNTDDSPAVATGSPIVVTGNLISWPDNGWYQVQDEATYSEVCAGVRSCTVAPGTYVVINHSTKIRYPGIKVADASDVSSDANSNMNSELDSNVNSDTNSDASLATLQLITRSTVTGAPSSSISNLQATSADGRYVFFVSSEGDLNGVASPRALYRYDVDRDEFQSIRAVPANTSISLNSVSDDGDSVVYAVSSNLFYANAADNFGPRKLADVLSGGERVTRAVLSGDGNVLAFNGHRYDQANRSLQKITQTTAPSTVDTENALEWSLSAASSISNDGTITVYRGSVEPSLGGSFSFTPATFVHDSASGTTRAIGVWSWNLACGSCAPLDGSRAAPVISGDGTTVLFSALPEAEFGLIDPSADIYRFDRVSDTITRLDGMRGAYQLRLSDNGRVLAYKVRAEHRLRLLDTGEDRLLTSFGLAPCGRACTDGEGISIATLSGDGQRVIYSVYEQQRDETGIHRSMGKLYTIADDTTVDLLAKVPMQAGFNEAAIAEFSASDDATTIAYSLGNEERFFDQIWLLKRP